MIFHNQGTVSTIYGSLLSEKGEKESNDKLNIEYDWDFLEAQFKRMSKNKSKYPKNNWQKPYFLSEI